MYGIISFCRQSSEQRNLETVAPLCSCFSLTSRWFKNKNQIKKKNPARVYIFYRPRSCRRLFSNCGHEGSIELRRWAVVILMQIHEADSLTWRLNGPTEIEDGDIFAVSLSLILNNPSVEEDKWLPIYHFPRKKKKTSYPEQQQLPQLEINEFVGEPPAKFPHEHADQSLCATLLRDWPQIVFSPQAGAHFFVGFGSQWRTVLLGRTSGRSAKGLHALSH